MADQGFLLNGNNAKYDYRYRAVWGDTDITSGFKMTYNGSPVVYVPKEWANQGLFLNNNQYLSPGYLNKDAWQYLKPATLEPGKWNETLSARLSGVVNNPLDGYIIDEKKFQELKLDKAQQTPQWTTLGKPNPPISGIGEDNGKLVYVGKNGNDRNGELVTYNETGAGNLYAHTSESSFWGDVGRTLGSLGPATLLLNAVLPGLGTAVYAGTQVGQGIATGNFGKAALNIAMMSLPGAGGAGVAQGTIFEIPGVANSVKTISDTLGVSAAVAGGIVNTTMNLLANGGSLVDAIKTTLAKEVGEGAAQYASQFAGLQGMKGLDTILKSVTKESTTAALLNKDVGAAAKGAFVNSAVPIALQTTPGWEKLSKTQQNALTSSAIAAVQGGKMDINSALRNYAGEVFTEGAKQYLPASFTDQQKQLALDTIKAGIQGKPLDKALQTAMLTQAKTAVADQVAKTQGWQSDADKQAAVKQLGAKATPKLFYDKTAQSQGWEDFAAKQDALTKYGANITPADYSAKEMGWDSYDQKLAAQKQYGPSIKADDYTARQQGWEDVQAKEAAIKKYGANITPANYEAAEAGWKSAAEKADAISAFGGGVSPAQYRQLSGLATEYDTKQQQYQNAKNVVDYYQNVLNTAPRGSQQYNQAQAQLGAATAQMNASLAQVNAVKQQLESTAKSVAATAPPASGAAVSGLTAGTVAAPSVPTTPKGNDKLELKTPGNDAEADAISSMRRFINEIPALPAEQQTALKNYFSGDKNALQNYSNLQKNADEAIATQRQLIATSPSGVFDSSGRPITKEEYQRLPSGATVYDEQGNAIKLSETAINIAGTQETQLGTLVQLGKTAPEKAIPGPLTALFGGQEGGGGTTGGGFSLIGKTGSGDAVYRKEGSDFSVITFADGSAKAVNPKTMEVYVLPPKQAEEIVKNATISPSVQTVPSVPSAPSRLSGPSEFIYDLPAQKEEEIVRPVEPKTPVPPPVPEQPKPVEPTPTPTPTSAKPEVTATPTPTTPTPATPKPTPSTTTTPVTMPTSGQGATTPTPSPVPTTVPTPAPAPSPTSTAATEAANQALAALAASTGQQIGDLRKDFQSQFEAARSQGATADQALQRAIDAVGQQAAAAKQAAEQAAAAQAKTAEQSAAAQSALQSKLAVTDQKLADFAVQTGQNFTDLKGQFDAAFRDAQTKGASADQALQTAINRVATDAAANQRATGEQIGKLGADVGTVQTALSQLGATTQAQFSDVNARIDQLQKQGMSQAEATSQALRELTGGQTQIAQQLAASQEATKSALGGLESKFDARVAELVGQGQSYQTATNKALSELATGQQQLGTSLRGEIAGLSGDFAQRLAQAMAAQAGSQEAATAALRGEIGGVQTGLGQQIAGLGQQLGTTIGGLQQQFGTTTQGLQNQINQAQQQAQFGNLLALLGMSKQQKSEMPAIPLVGQINPYEFSSDLLQGVYKPSNLDFFGSNDQLLKMARGQ